MAANRYSQPQAPLFQNNYLSTYVGKPLEAMQNLLATRQGIQDQFMGTLQQELVETPAGWKADPVDQQYLEAKQKEIAQFAEQLSTQDLTQRENQQALQQKIAQVSADKGIQAALTTAKNRQALQEQISKLQAEGKLHENNAVWATKAYQDYAANGGAAAGNVYGEQVLAPYVDTYQKKKQYYSELKANGGDSIAMLAAEGGKIAYKNGYLSIDGARIGQRTKEIFQDYLNSQEGKQEYNDAIASGQDAMKYIWAQLQSTGAGYTYSQSSSNLDAALNKKRDEKKEKEEAANYTMMPAFAATTAQEDVEFDGEGKFRTQQGIFEMGAANYQRSRQAGQGFIQAITHALGGALQASGVFGQEQAEGLEKAVNLPITDLQKAYELEAAHRKQLAAKGLPVPAMPSQKDWYSQTHSPTEARNYEAPILTDTKAQNAAYGQVVESGWINNAALVDPATNEQVLGKDIIQFEEGKVKQKVQVLSSPNAKWSTQYDPNSILVNVEGKMYVAKGAAQLLQRAPRNTQEATMQNAANMDWIKSKKYGRFTFQKVNADGSITPIEVESFYNPAIMDQPQLVPVKK